MMTFTLYKWGGLLPLLLPLSDVIFLFVFLFTQHKRKRDVKECTQEIEQIKDNIKRCEIEIDNIKLYLGGMTNNFI